MFFPMLKPEGTVPHVQTQGAPGIPFPGSLASHAAECSLEATPARLRGRSTGTSRGCTTRGIHLGKTIGKPSENTRKILVEWDLMVFNPLVNVYVSMERSTIFHGKTHYFDWAIFHSYLKLPEGMFHDLKDIWDVKKKVAQKS